MFRVFRLCHTFDLGQQPPRGNSSIAVEDRLVGGVTERSMRSGVEETETFSVSRSGVVGRPTSSGRCIDVWSRASDRDRQHVPVSDRFCRRPGLQVARFRTWYGLRGQRIGEASNPGPGSGRRRTQRMRALQGDSRNVECQGTVVDVDTTNSSCDTQMDSDDSKVPLVKSGRFAVLSMSEDEHQFADAVRAPPGVCDHGRVASSDSPQQRFQEVAQDPSGECPRQPLLPSPRALR